jgi:hypothetical protein
MSLSVLGKTQISVDTATLANGDTIGSYLVSAAGTLLTHTTVGGKEALDVYQQGVFAEDSAHTSGDLGQFILGVRNDAGTPFGADGDYVPLSIDASGALRVSATLNEAGDYAEDASHTSGDIGYFNLAVRRDTRTSGTSADGDYASFNVNTNGELWVHDEDTLGQLTTANSTLTSILTELQSTSFAEDAAHTSGDLGTHMLAVRKDAAGTNTSADGDYSSLQTWSEGSLKVIDAANSSIKQQQVSVTSTAASLTGGSPLANRRSLLIQNVSGGKIWVGSSTVTSSGATAGIEVPSGAFLELEVTPAIDVFAVKSGGGSVVVNILEMA